MSHFFIFVKQDLRYFYFFFPALPLNIYLHRMPVWTSWLWRVESDLLACVVCIALRSFASPSFISGVCWAVNSNKNRKVTVANTTTMTMARTAATVLIPSSAAMYCKAQPVLSAVDADGLRCGWLRFHLRSYFVTFFDVHFLRLGWISTTIYRLSKNLGWSRLELEVGKSSWIP